MKTLFIIPTQQGVIVPTLQRWNAAVDAPASSLFKADTSVSCKLNSIIDCLHRHRFEQFLNKDAGASSYEFQRQTVGSIKKGVHA